MKIQILGTSCPACKQLYATTKKVIEELKIDTEVEYIDDMTKMIEMGVMTSPVLVIDGKPVLIGKGKTEEEIKNAIQNPIEEKQGGCAHCSCGGGC